MRLEVTENATPCQALLNAIAHLRDEATPARLYSLLGSQGTPTLLIAQTLRELEDAGELHRDGSIYRRGRRPADRGRELVLVHPGSCQRSLF